MKDLTLISQWLIPHLLRYLGETLILATLFLFLNFLLELSEFNRWCDSDSQYGSRLQHTHDVQLKVIHVLYLKKTRLDGITV